MSAPGGDASQLSGPGLWWSDTASGGRNKFRDEREVATAFMGIYILWHFHCIRYWGSLDAYYSCIAAKFDIVFHFPFSEHVKSTFLHKEKASLLGRAGKCSEELQLLVQDHDLETAEAYCFRAVQGSNSQFRQTLFLTLFQRPHRHHCGSSQPQNQFTKHRLSLIRLKKIHWANNWFENAQEQATHF